MKIGTCKAERNRSWEQQVSPPSVEWNKKLKQKKKVAAAVAWRVCLFVCCLCKRKISPAVLIELFTTFYVRFQKLKQLRNLFYIK